MPPFKLWLVTLILSIPAFAEPVKGPAIENKNPESKIPYELQAAQISEKLGAIVDVASIRLKDESGRNVALSEYFKPGHPVVLVPVYYGCPNLCTFTLNGLVEVLKKSDLIPGQKFEVVAVSMDHTEKPDLAQAKKDAYLKEYARPEGNTGWHFLVGSKDQVAQLFGQVGFGYRYDEKLQQFAHSAALIVLTPEGKVSRYLYGVQWEPKDFKFALLEASNGKIGSLMDRVLLFCYHYDPSTRGYNVQVVQLMRIGGLFTLFIVGIYMLNFWSRQRRSSHGIKG